jgi:hypothetical protein
VSGSLHPRLTAATCFKAEAISSGGAEFLCFRWLCLLSQLDFLGWAIKDTRLSLLSPRIPCSVASQPIRRCPSCPQRGHVLGKETGHSRGGSGASILAQPLAEAAASTALENSCSHTKWYRKVAGKNVQDGAH